MSVPAHGRTALKLVGVAVTMGALSFAAVPFYDWFCRTTGFAGTVGVAEKAPDVVLEDTVLVRFDASKAAGMPWSFKPQQYSMRVKLGETALAFYEAHNPADRPVAGTASFNVQPDAAGGYFTKIECFCFTEQTLGPGESRAMPVVFYIDPAIARDRDADTLNTITLSYTFFEVGGQTPAAPETRAAATPAGAGA